MENNKNKKSMKFQGDMFNFCDFIQVFVFTRNHHLNTPELVRMPGDAGSPKYVYPGLQDQFFKAYTTWSLSHKVRSCSAVHCSCGLCSAN